MSFDPREILNLCKSICYTHEEALTRTIMNRAYFSAFLYAREYLKEKHNVSFTDTSRDHTIVETLIRIRISRLLGSKIRTLRETRIVSDYNLNTPAIITTQSGAQRSFYFDNNEARDSIQLADDIISSLL